MKKIIFSIICSLSLLLNISANEFPLIIDHDSGVDDIISATLQLLHNPKRIKAITIAPADSFAEPAAYVMLQIKNLFLSSDIELAIGISRNEGINPFPDEWRKDAWGLARLKLWGDRNEDNLKRFSLEKIPSSLRVLVKTLRESPTQVDILETGPCSNIAEVLFYHPELKDKIHCIYMMGGALYVKGNVVKDDHDGSAEWNIHNNPQAFFEILQSQIPLKLVALDATQYTPIRHEFIAELEKNIEIKSCRLVYESLQIIKFLIDCGQYMFWDTLTSAVVINPKIIGTKKVKINVKLDGPSMGQIFEDKNGFEVEVATWADQELFEKTVLNILLRENPKCV